MKESEQRREAEAQRIAGIRKRRRQEGKDMESYKHGCFIAMIESEEGTGDVWVGQIIGENKSKYQIEYMKAIRGKHEGEWKWESTKGEVNGEAIIQEIKWMERSDGVLAQFRVSQLVFSCLCL